MNGPEPPLHGGDLHAAVERYRIARSDWLDLSTGINPRAYPVPAFDAALFRDLPNQNVALRAAAQHCCGAATAPLFAAGSQALIQWLPLLRTRLAGAGRVAVPAIGYREHAFRWHWSGHRLIQYDAMQPRAVDEVLQRERPDVLVVINPHNPLGTTIDAEQLLAWRGQLAARNGWLVVDEAFIDATPRFSVAAHTQLPGLIVLRSLGKFFGLAGIRIGYAFCSDELRAALQIAVGPWAVAAPAQAIAEIALRDRQWQAGTRAQLQRLSAANAEVLCGAAWCDGHSLRRSALFNSVALPAARAHAVAETFARVGILLRRIDIDAGQSILRFGLVDTDRADHWQRFSAACASA